MVMNFQIIKKGSDFVLQTGVTLAFLKDNFQSETRYLSSFENNGTDFLIPRMKLCDVLDNCFDHFTEESLVSITKLLNKDTESGLRDQIREKSISKRKQSGSRKSADQYNQEQERQRQEQQRQEQQRQEKERLIREQRELLQQTDSYEHKVSREHSNSRSKHSSRDLNYNEPVEKSEIVRWIARIRKSMDESKRMIDSLEHYVQRM